MSGTEPGWKAELRDAIDEVLNQEFFEHLIPRVVQTSVSRVLEFRIRGHIEAAYQRGLIAGRSQAGYTTRRKKKEETCPTSTSAPDATGSAASAGEP